MPTEHQLPTVPPSLGRTPNFSRPSLQAEEITEQRVFCAELAIRNNSASSRMRNKSTGPSARTDLASCSTNSQTRRLNAEDLAGGANDLSSPRVTASWYRSLMIAAKRNPDPLSLNSMS